MPNALKHHVGKYTMYLSIYGYHAKSTELFQKMKRKEKE